MIAALGVGLLAWLAGHGVLGLSRATRLRGRVELECTALLAGLALLAVLFTNVLLAWGPLSPLTGEGIAIALAVPGVLCLRRNRRLVQARDPADRWSAGQLGLLAAIVAFCGLAVFMAASSPVQGFDAVYHYAYRGRLLFHEGFGGEAWTGGADAVGRVMTHPGYPPGVAVLEVVVGYVRGVFDEDAARPLWALFALAPAGLLWAGLRDRGRTPALIGALLWISLPLMYYWRLPNGDPWLAVYGLLFGPEAGAARFEGTGPWQRAASWNLDATAGLPLAAFLFGAFACLVRARGADGERADGVCAGLLLAGALLAKNEGTALVPVLLVALALAPGSEPRGRALGSTVLPVLVALALAAGWFVARRALPTVDEAYASRLTPGNLVASLDRVPEVAGAFARAFGNPLLWNLLWPLFAVALAWGLRGPKRLLRHAALPAVLAVLGALAVYFAVMLVTPWELPALEGTGIPTRLLFHVAPLAVFAVVALLWERPAEPDAQSR